MSIFITLYWLHNPFTNLSLLKKLLKLNKTVSFFFVEEQFLNYLLIENTPKDLHD